MYDDSPCGTPPILRYVDVWPGAPQLVAGAVPVPPVIPPVTPPTPTTTGATDFLFTQGTPSTMWTIVHNLGRYPSITTIDVNGHQMIGEETYPALSTVVITFSMPVAGLAYLV